MNLNLKPNTASRNYSLLLHVTGPDRPGITAMLTGHLSQANYQILDMGQYVTHGLLSLSLLVAPEKNCVQNDVLKDILFDTKALGLNCEFQIFQNDHQAPPKRNEMLSEEWALTLVDETQISLKLLAEITAFLASEKINIYRIDHPAIQSEQKMLEIILHVPTDHRLSNNELKTHLLSLGHKYKNDLSFVRNDLFRFHKRLIVFDMDSTLTEGEVIDELAKIHHVEKEVSSITREAMNGKFDFAESLRQRVSLLKGLKQESIEEVKQNMVFSSGSREFMKTIKQLGFKTAVVSGGFKPFVEHVKKELGLDYAFGNELEMNNGEVTGKLVGRMIDADAKSEILETLAQAESIHLQQVVAVGDGSNDLKMLLKAGLGIAYHAKEVVKKNTSSHLTYGPMTNLLTFLGIPHNF
ncbi:MAG: phosphoserine phosphatase SerB [Bacteriovoracaceae bacterium]|nr:phosphoserine phosphatase SerB [Bacteriovoracaceae bacterium]